MICWPLLTLTEALQAYPGGEMKSCPWGEGGRGHTSWSLFGIKAPALKQLLHDPLQWMKFVRSATSQTQPRQTFSDKIICAVFADHKRLINHEWKVWWGNDHTCWCTVGGCEELWCVYQWFLAWGLGIHPQGVTRPTWESWENMKDFILSYKDIKPRNKVIHCAVMSFVHTLSVCFQWDDSG